MGFTKENPVVNTQERGRKESKPTSKAENHQTIKHDRKTRNEDGQK
jgi:hypothetical protein